MAANDCRPQLHACAMRVCRLDSNGVPTPGANNQVVSDALISLKFTPVYKDGEEVEFQNACGDLVESYRSADQFRRGDIEISLVTPDPFLCEMLSDGLLLTAVPRPKGFSAPAVGPVGTAAVSIEVWTKRIDDGDLDVSYPYAWWTYPKVKNLRIAEHTHEANPLTPTFTGQCYENINWYNGPDGTWPGLSDRVYQWLPTATKPAASCGYLTTPAS